MKITTLLERKTPEQRDFVKYSRIKKPVYHATTAEFEVFDIEKSDLGPHFGTEEQADYVVKNRISGRPGVNPYKKVVLLNISNPIRLKDEGSFHSDAIADQLLRKKLIDKKLATEIKEAGWRQRRHYDSMVRQILTRAGYDGVVYKNTHEGDGDSYIVFSANQIRSLFS